MIAVDEIAETSLAGLCAAAGWPHAARSGDLLVKLEVDRAGPPFWARVARAAEGGIDAWVDLAAAAREVEGIDQPHPAVHCCSAAADALLAAIARGMRCGLGTLERTPGSCGFLVRLSVDATGEDLADALSALSVACRVGGPEIRQMLTDPVIAKLYLAQSNRAGGRSADAHPCPGARALG